MPAKHFFLMLEKSTQLLGLNYSHLCDISFVSAASPAVYEEFKAKYNRMAGYKEEKPEFEEIHAPSTIKEKVGNSQDSLTKLKEMMAVVRRGLH